ncbi:long-chain-fatty-acid--CoA ligase [Sandaracinobacter sp. RS1-74]|uniref:long-chain-fatty-acid--CoA ligase n=1 Tax=Sandaracinobacteroides sayramensis TaxID=2913411 RepID=UPI001EDA3A9E|nr:long-chain-fatty-acid--CoA ligase [Sandaracinobacteroides sayramensis]MCG2841010.1 long-chain-fatty-acid--CoA ligase [Sandaracinobacteroides sayramensis]
MMTSGTMQEWPLNVWRLIDHAAQNHGEREIVSLTCEGHEVRTDWRQVQGRAKQVAEALRKLGVKAGDRVGTLAWNTHRHIESWYGISGMGAVAHTINPRLFEEQIAYIANHAEDRVLFFDLTFVKLVEALAPKLKTIEHYVLLTDRAHMPADSSLKLICYEEMIGGEDADAAWTAMPETAPSGLCYTSGTTGNPKGVQYSHRANVLHSYGACMGDVLDIRSRAVVLPVVPMYHANAWGVPYAAAATGAKLVMCGPHFDAPTIASVIRKEEVTLTLAVPTIWLGMLQHLEATGADLKPLERVVIGGSAAPRSMIEAFEEKYGVDVCHAWGMTEMTPLGTIGSLSADALKLPREKQIDLKCKQGRGIFGVELKLVDDEGRELPRDGVAFGRLLVRGPWIVASYFKGDGGEILDKDGWFDTGDVATIDPGGYMQITDRSKDVIKSGGEWISSIEIENIAIGCPGVAEAAVIGVRHPKWDERPLLVVIRKEGSVVTAAEILEYLQGRIAKWWMPDAVEFVDSIPHTATGKIQKVALREQFAGYQLA